MFLKIDTNSQSFKIIAFIVAFFIIGIVKVLFLMGEQINYFILFELFFFLMFLSYVYRSDKIIGDEKAKSETLDGTLTKREREWSNERQRLVLKINHLESQINRDKNFGSYKDKILRELFDNEEVRSNKHLFLHHLVEVFDASVALLYKRVDSSDAFKLEMTYGVDETEPLDSFVSGEGFCGQAVKEATPLVVEDIPEEYPAIVTGLGESKAKYLYCLPIKKEDKVVYLIELLSFSRVEVDKMWKSIEKKLIKHNVV